MKEKTAKLFREIQINICKQIEEVDKKEIFKEDVWERPDLEESYGGGGFSRVLAKGDVFEKAGVNFSEVSGTMPKAMCKKLTGQDINTNFFATGVSLVIHPDSPFIPTTHANIRYLEVGGLSWFGGGGDLTPYYHFEEDSILFHQNLKTICDKHSKEYYPKFKKWCDEYFYLTHRKEARGIGGIFFDYLGKDENTKLNEYFNFTADIGHNLMNAYIDIANKRKKNTFSEAEKKFQLIRRGRYAEFNLVTDRGTKFGLETNGRTESILMSLPPVVHWDYCPKVEKGSKEEEIINIVSNKARDWL
ncbi:UNVERIFIED_CONTAM: hypothetical protein GTU68_060359 [Idotea baltica]|nr:hypothetical protein [Idotea baltica]